MHEYSPEGPCRSVLNAAYPTVFLAFLKGGRGGRLARASCGGASDDSVGGRGQEAVALPPRLRAAGGHRNSDGGRGEGRRGPKGKNTNLEEWKIRF